VVGNWIENTGKKFLLNEEEFLPLKIMLIKSRYWTEGNFKLLIVLNRIKTC